MQWLNVSYSAWFNAKRQRVGHVFQGRFRSTLIDSNGAWLLDMSVYLHLNPVRVSALGLDKATNKAEAHGFMEPDRKKIQTRLLTLRQHRWSSYRVYGNYGKGADCLVTDEILRRAGGQSAYRKYIQQHVTRGLNPSEFTPLTERVAVGSRAFLDTARALVTTTSPEQPDRSFATQSVSFEKIVAVVENVKKETWDEFHNHHGDWALPMVLHLARLRSGLTLREIGELAGGIDYKAVSHRVRRFKKQLTRDRKLQRMEKECKEQMANGET